jgi:hypothetical protein
MASFEKFGKNCAGIRNSKGQELTVGYIRRYCECWARIANGYTAPNRKEIIDSYTSDTYLLAHANLTGSQIGGECAKDMRWACNKAKTPATVVTNSVMTPAAPVTPVTAEEAGYEEPEEWSAKGDDEPDDPQADEAEPVLQSINSTTPYDPAVVVSSALLGRKPTRK